MLNPRRVAVQALMKQEQDGYANLVLDAVLEKADLEPRDKGFVSAVFYGTLERLITLDYCLNLFCKKPVAKMDSVVRCILRSGLYQAKYMQVPPAAAVNEAVKLTKAMGKSSASGMVNAVLRKAIAAEPEKAQFANEMQRLSVLYSVDEGVASLLIKYYPDQAEEIFAAAFLHADTTIRVNPLKITAEELRSRLSLKGLQVQPGAVENSLTVSFKGSPAAEKEFREGLYHVQGIPSQLAALAVDARPGQKVVDLCAAPGGKSAVLAQQMENSGQLFSCDLAANRLPLIEKQFARLGISNAKVLHQDGAIHNAALESADRILCDVPCSGFGIMAKKPDIRYKKADDLESLQTIQRAILENAATYLKPSGRLVYSTCTILPGENQEAVQAFLKAHSEFHLVPGPAAGAVDTGYGSLFLPGRNNPDGFFIAIMEKS